MTTKRPGIVAVAVGALILAACGASSTDELVLDEYAFTPSTIVVPAETEGFTLTMRNEGTLPHDLTVEGLPDDAPVHLLLFPESGDVPYVLPPLPAGTYEVWCSVEGHRQAGMTGTLVVGGGGQ